MNPDYPPKTKQQCESCIHYRAAFRNETCRAGLRFKDVQKTNEGGEGLSLPCHPTLNFANAKCEKFAAPTLEQMAANEAAIKNVIESLANGVSPCCKAPLDTSAVCQTGRYKGHGPRFCSACGHEVSRV